MNFQDITNKLKQILDEEQLNEMVINYGRSLGKTNNTKDAIDKILQQKAGHIKTTKQLTVKSPVTEADIKQGLYEPIMKGIIVEKKYPITIVWGEPDKGKATGHGLCHIIQGHGNQILSLKNQLDSICDRKKATIENNYAILKTPKYKFIFALFDLNGEPDEAVLITAYYLK